MLDKYKKYKKYLCSCCGRKLEVKAEGCPAYPAHRFMSGTYDEIGERFIKELAEKETQQ